MKTTIFEYTQYKKLIHDLIASYPHEGRGQRKLLAQGIGCQIAYVTHVLSGNSDFSTEQALAAATHFKLTYEETEYFLFLVQENRAGSTELRKYYRKLLEDLRKKHSDLKDRVNIPETVPYSQREIYYSSWQYAAIHVALTIPALQSLDALCNHFHLSSERVLKILDFLLATGMAFKEQNLYRTISPWVFLDKESPLISKLHANWRHRALNAIESEPKPDHLHYSATFSVAKKDLPKLREIILKSVESCTDLIKTSEEEVLACLCVDFFQL